MLQGGRNANWLQDAMSLSDGTVGGLADVIAKQMHVLPEESKPEWANGKTVQQLKSLVATSLFEAMKVGRVCNDHVNSQRKANVAFDQAYAEVQPLLEAAATRPVEAEPEAYMKNVFTTLAEGGKPEEQEEAEEESDGDLYDFSAPLDPTLFPYEAGPAVVQKTQAVAVQKKSPEPQTASRPDAKPMVGNKVIWKFVDCAEQLLLLGDVNRYNVRTAATHHKFKQLMSSIAESQGTCCESEVLVKVGEAGCGFQIVSAQHLLEWRVFPVRPAQGGAQVELVPDADERVDVMLAMGEHTGQAIRGAEFFIGGSTVETTYKVKVRLSKVDGATVWCESILVG